MTYCFEFKYNNDVFLYADTALTYPLDQSNLPNKTSFGEEKSQASNEFVQEAGIKIHKVADNCFLAISANDFFRAHDLVDILRDNYQDNKDFSETIRFLNNSLGLLEDENGREVAFLIAHYFDQKAVLYKWLSCTRKLQPIQDCCAIGSLSDDDQKPILGLYNYLTSNQDIANSDLLVGMAGGLQSISLSGKFIENKNVGGTITGMKLGKPGVEWLGDTIYALSNSNGTIDDFVMVANRDGGFATRSTYVEATRYFVTVEKTADIYKWMEKWREPTEKIFDSFLLTNWILMNPLNNIVIVVRANKPTSSTPICRVDFEGISLSIAVLAGVDEILLKAKFSIVVFGEDQILHGLNRFLKTPRMLKFLEDSNY